MAQTTKVRKARAKKDVKRAIRKIDPETVKEILSAEDETLEKKMEAWGSREPGQTVDGTSKVPWTVKEMEKRFPIVEMFSEENIKITWNGVPYQLYQNATHYVPNVIRDAYMRHRRQQSSAMTTQKLARELSSTGFETIVELGAGSLSPEE